MIYNTTIVRLFSSFLRSSLISFHFSSISFFFFFVLNSNRVPSFVRSNVNVKTFVETSIVIVMDRLRRNDFPSPFFFFSFSRIEKACCISRWICAYIIECVSFEKYVVCFLSLCSKYIKIRIYIYISCTDLLSCFLSFILVSCLRNDEN